MSDSPGKNRVETGTRVAARDPLASGLLMSPTTSLVGHSARATKHPTISDGRHWASRLAISSHEIIRIRHRALCEVPGLLAALFLYGAKHSVDIDWLGNDVRGS